MKNLSKHLLLLTISLLTLLLFAFSAEKAAAQSTNCSLYDNSSYYCNQQADCIWRSTQFTYGYCDFISSPASAPTPTDIPLPANLPRPQVSNLEQCYNQCSFDEEQLCYEICDAQYGVRTPLPTSPPSTANCGSLTCSSNQTCISSGGSPYCLDIGQGRIGSYCGTPSDSPNNDACSSGYCDSALRCANPSQPPATLRWKQIASCPAPTTATTPVVARPTQRPGANYDCSSLYPSCSSGYSCKLDESTCDVDGEICLGTCTVITALPPTPTSTPTPIPNLFSCVDQTGPSAGNYECRSITNGSIQCRSGFASFTPSSPYTGTSCEKNGQGCCKQGAVSTANPFACQTQIGDYAGNYACAEVLNRTTQCSPGFIPYSPKPPFTGDSCGKDRGCCIKAAPTPNPTQGVSQHCPTDIIDTEYQCSKENLAPRCRRVWRPGQTDCAQDEGCWLCPGPTATPIPSSQCRENVDCPVCLGGNSCQPKPGQTTAGPGSCECRPIPVISPTPGPTSPPIPTPTPAPGSVLAALSLTLEPIGRNREDLDSSVRLQPVTIELFDSTKSQLQLTTPANSINQVEYDPDDGKFKRTINLGSNLAAGDYIVKVKVGNYLKRKYTRILTVKASEQTQTFNVEKLTLPAGNTNNDTTIDTADYGLIVSCFGAKQNTASCADKKAADIDHNKRIDGIDYNTVLRNIGKSDE